MEDDEDHLPLFEDCHLKDLIGLRINRIQQERGEKLTPVDEVEKRKIKVTKKTQAIFEILLPTIDNKCIFFLDGHWSSGDTGRGEKDCPLNEEITHINNLFEHEAIIIIDDFRLFGLDSSSGKLNEDWSDINKDKLLHILNSRITQVYHLDSVCAKDDRLIIHIKSK
jgi:hypothetical protein